MIVSTKQVPRKDSGSVGLPRTWKIALACALAVVVIASLPAFGVVHLPWAKDYRLAGPAGGGQDGPWHEVFSEDFDEPAALGSFLDVYGRSFTAYPYPWTDTSREVRSNPGYYYPQKTLSAQGGALDIWLHYDSSLGKYLVAAALPKLQTMTYGRFAMRLRSDKIASYKASPMLWPDSDHFPNDGEIDMPEGVLSGKNFVAYSHFAQPKGTPGPIQNIFPTGVNGSDWHEYETAWSPGKTEFFVDGVSIGVSTRAVPSKPMHWVLQFETQLSSQAPPVTAQGHVHIDWLRAWEWTG